MKEFAKVAAPADSSRDRLRQMRKLASSFQVTTVANKYYNYQLTQLRLMPQPLYRYKETPNDLLDGALFVFADGTDPELVLLIEAREKDQRYQWHYGLARFTNFKIIVRQSDKEIWKVPLLPSFIAKKDPEDPYYLRIVKEIQTDNSRPAPSR